MKRFFTSFSILKLTLCVLLAGIYTGSNAQNHTAVSFQSAYSFNRDPIIEGWYSGLTPSLWWMYTNSYVDTCFSRKTGTGAGNYYIFSSAAFASGVPCGTQYISTNATYNYPKYNLAAANAPNTLHLEGTVLYDTMLFTSQTLIGDLYLLGAAGGEGTSTTATGSSGAALVTILFTDGTTQIVSGVSFPNYRDSTSTLPYAITNIGRYNGLLSNVNAGVDGDAGRPRLFDIRVPLAYTNYGKQMKGFRIQKTSGDQLNLLGACVDSNSCLPTTNVTSPTPSINTTSIDTVIWNSVAGSQGYEWCIEAYPTATAAFNNYTQANMPIWPSTTTPVYTTTDTFIAKTTSTAINTLTPNTVYVVFVRNKCSSTSKSVWNKYSFITPDCTKPYQTYIFATPITTHSATLTWRMTYPTIASIITTSSPTCLGFEYGLTVGSSTTTPPTSTTYVSYANAMAGDSSIYFPNLLTGQAYVFWVRNNCTGTSYSDWAYKAFSTLACPSAGLPDTIAGSNVPGSVSVTWPGSTDSAVIGYDYALMVANLTPSASDWAPVTNDTMTFNNLNAGQIYRFYVRSNCNNVTHAGLYKQFLNPFYSCDTSLTLAADNVNMHGVDIHWSPGSSPSPDPIQLYNITLRTIATIPNIYTPVIFPTTYPNPTLPHNYYYTTTTDTFFHPTNLAPNTTYYFYVRTQCDTVYRTQSTNVTLNTSAWKGITFTTPDTCVPPIIPTINNITAHTAHMEWNLYYGIDGYEYYIDQLSTDPVSPPPAGSWPLITYNQVDPLNLFSGTNYWFHLRTKCDATNYSDWTNTPFTTTALCNTGSPSPALQAGTNNPTSTSAIFTWAAVQDATRYEVATTTTSTPPSAPDDVISITSYTSNGLTPNTNYYFHIKAKCSPNDSTAWTTIAFKTPVSTSVSNLNGNQPILVYPNPVSDDLVIDVQTNPKGTLQVIDMTGKVLFSKTVTDQKTTLDMKPYSTGVYMVKYFTDEQNVQIVRIQKL